MEEAFVSPPLSLVPDGGAIVTLVVRCVLYPSGCRLLPWLPRDEVMDIGDGKMIKARLFEKGRLAFSSGSLTHFHFYNCETESFRQKTNKSVF